MKLRFIQLLLLVAVGVFIFGASWVLNHSYASGEYDDQGMTAAFRTVPSEQNLFSSLDYLEQDGFRLIDDETSQQALNRFVTGADWDEAAANRLLAAYADKLATLTAAIDRPYFQSGPADWGPSAASPNYKEYLALNNLLLLQASVQQRSHQYALALTSVTGSLTFATRLQHDENGSLVAHIIGLTMLESTLQWLERAVQSGALTDQQLEQLAHALAGLPGFDADGFRKTLMSEFMVTKAMIDAVSKELLKEHGGESAATASGSQLESATRVGTQISGAFSFLLATGLSNYLLQPDTLLEQRAAQIQALILLTELPCQAVSFPAPQQEQSAWDIFKPGGVLKEMLMVGTTSYHRYYEQRCLSHTQIESTKALVAIQRYERAKGVLPEHLRRLVPDYLTQEPRDWFNGKSLKFSKLNAWVYSSGLNYRDEAGNKEAILANRCGTNPACINEPTFALRAAAGSGS